MSRVQASVTCYHCGHVSGHIVADSEASLRLGTFVPAAGSTGASPGASGLVRSQRLRCFRCGGPVFLDEVEVIREAAPIVITWQGRGRPPKKPRPEIGVVIRDTSSEGMTNAQPSGDSPKKPARRSFRAPRAPSEKATDRPERYSA